MAVEERPAPEPGEGELLVEVAAAGMNGADLLQRSGHYPPPPGVPEDIPGLELAGTVVATGGATERFAPGDRVMSIVAGGGQAELAAVPDATVVPVGASMSWAEAGGFAEVFTTAHDALFTQCGLVGGERLLVTGAAGGVGLAAVQLGRAVGAEVVASVRRPELRPEVAGFGATVVIDPSEVDEHGPYDVVIELVGAPGIPAALRSLALHGRIVVIGVGAGSRTEVDLRAIMGKRAVLRGSTLRSRTLEEKAEAARRVMHDVLPLVESGRVRVPIAATFELGEAHDAYERFASGGKLGKIVLEVRRS